MSFSTFPAPTEGDIAQARPTAAVAPLRKVLGKVQKLPKKAYIPAVAKEIKINAPTIWPLKIIGRLMPGLPNHNTKHRHYFVDLTIGVITENQYIIRKK